MPKFKIQVEEHAAVVLLDEYGGKEQTQKQKDWHEEGERGERMDEMVVVNN